MVLLSPKGYDGIVLVYEHNSMSSYSLHGNSVFNVLIREHALAGAIYVLITPLSPSFQSSGGLNDQIWGSKSPVG